MGKWIFSYLKKYRGLFIFAIFLGSLSILFSGALMFTSGYLITKAATRPESILMVYVPIVGVRTFGIGRSVLRYIEKLIGHQITLKILSDMRIRLYRLIEPQGLFLRSRFQSGDILGVLANDIEHLQDFYLNTILPSIISLVIYSVIILCTGLFSISFSILLAMLMGLLIFVAPAISFIVTKEINSAMKKERNELYQQFTDTIFGISDWILSRNTTNVMNTIEEKENRIQAFEKKKIVFVNWRDVFQQLILGIIVAVVIYWANGEVQDGIFSATMTAAFGLAILSLMESFLPISSATSEVTTYQDSIKRLERFEEESVLPFGKNTEELSVDTTSVSIELKNVSFNYSADAPILENFNLKIRQGEKIAILGRSGSGKSTLLNLLMGELSPTTGEALLNDISANSLGERIPKMMSVLNQKAYLFNTTVMNNIRLGNPEATNEEVYKVAEMVQLHQMIMQLPKGYETQMHETGMRFSGGERQRIALARILLQKTPVVILDEPTIGLDPITELRLLNTMFEMLAGKTIIWVTHHLTGVEKMDRILFLEKGKIVMDGSHYDLLNKAERYRSLYALDRPFR